MAAIALAPAGRQRLATVASTAEVINRLRAALVARDIVAPEKITAERSLYRCDARA